MKSSAYKMVHRHIEAIMPRLENPPGLVARHPYLSVTHSEFYPRTIFCWDNHHMALRFADGGKPEYLRHLVDTLLDYQEPGGYTPNVIGVDTGPIHGAAFHAQPFLFQAALIYLARTGERAWAEARFEPLLRYLGYYEKHQLTPLGLFRWNESWMSGVDNDVSTAFFLPETVVTPDINALMYLEYRAAAALAKRLGRGDDRRRLAAKAARLCRAVNKYLWYEKVGSYSAYNLLTRSIQFHLKKGPENYQACYYAFQSCSNLFPLYARMAPRSRARRMLRTYVLDERHFLSAFGTRSLSRSSPYYNNAFWGNPPRFGDHHRMANSNWQGPVWIPLCYFMFQALRFYGLKRESRDVADRTIKLLARSLKKIGAFTENYDAETGAPLYAPGYASWNILADRMHPELETGRWIMDPVFE